MADKWPLANGNWSNAANWNDGTKPQAGDTVYADGKTVTIDEDATVESVRTTTRSGGTAGGGFVLGDGVTLTVTLYVLAGSTNCISFSAAAAAIIGSVYGAGSAGTNVAAIINSGSGVLSITGSVFGGQGNANVGIRNTGTGTVAITGDLTVLATVNYQADGVRNESSGTVTVLGNINNSTGGQNYGIRNASTGTVEVIGNVTNNGATAAAIANLSTGVVVITGDVTGGNAINSVGVSNSGGIVLIAGDLIAGTGFGGVAVTNTSSGYLRVHGSFRAAGSGVAAGTLAFQSPVLAYVNGERYLTEYPEAAAVAPNYSGNTSYHYGALAGTSGHPTQADVRAATVYGPTDELTGTLAVPAAGSVALGVAVDDTVGTAVLSQQAVRDALKLAPSAGAAADGSIDDQLADILATGTGPYACTWTVEYDGTPLAGAAVALYLSGTLKGRGTTDTNGQVSMSVAPGVYDVAIVRDGYIHTPETHEVTSTASTWTATFDALTPIATVPTPTAPDTCTGYALVYDDDGVLEPSASICCRLVAEPDGSGAIVSDATRTEVSDAGGQVVFTGLWVGAQYRFWRLGSDKQHTITIDADDVDEAGRYPLPNFYG